MWGIPRRLCTHNWPQMHGLCRLTPLVEVWRAATRKKKKLQTHTHTHTLIAPQKSHKHTLCCAVDVVVATLLSLLLGAPRGQTATECRVFRVTRAFVSVFSESHTRSRSLGGPMRVNRRQIKTKKNTNKTKILLCYAPTLRTD